MILYSFIKLDMSSINYLHISSPGKIILCGEHAVVYGKKALACSINLRTHIILKKQSDSSNKFKISFLNLKKIIHLTKNDILNLRNKYENEKNVENLINSLKKENICDQLNSIYLLILQLNNLDWLNLSNYEAEINTELPIGAGLGSSASLSSCLVTAFLILNKNITFENHNHEFTNDQLNLINEYTFIIEKLFHGKPSGIDNSVVINGNYILFQKGQIVDKFKSNLNLNILIINSNLEKQTREQVAKVRELNECYNEIGTHLMDTIELITNKFINCLKDYNNESLNIIKDLIRMNQGLLYSLDISNYKLNFIINISNKFNYSCKITGAGGGGCCYSLINDQNNYQDYVKELNNIENINYFESNLGCEGIKIEKIIFL